MVSVKAFDSTLIMVRSGYIYVYLVFLAALRVVPAMRYTR